MVDWKLYIDSPQKRALDLCEGSLDVGNGWGDGADWGDRWGDGRGSGYRDSFGISNGDGWGGPDGRRDGGSSNKW